MWLRLFERHVRGPAARLLRAGTQQGIGDDATVRAQTPSFGLRALQGSGQIRAKIYAKPEPFPVQ